MSEADSTAPQVENSDQKETALDLLKQAEAALNSQVTHLPDTTSSTPAQVVTVGEFQALRQEFDSLVAAIRKASVGSPFPVKF